MRPIIGITVECEPDPQDARTHGKLELNWNYAQAVFQAGGTPILIPAMSDPKDVAEILDGWLIPGGNDIDASNFGEENHPNVVPIEQDRFDAEKALYKEINPEMPVLGICYGCQFLNVMRGGSLIQHLPDVSDRDTHTGGVLQRYEVDDDSKLGSISSVFEGKSYHHQAIKNTGHSLKVTAKAQDGTVEAIEATDRPWMVGVQWHPERTFEDPATRRLFENFIAAAKSYSQKKRLARI